MCAIKEAPEAALQSLDINGTEVTWTRSGAGPEIILPPILEFSLQGDSYASVGTMERMSDGWRFNGFIPPLNQIFYLRTRAQVSSSQYGSSSALIEGKRQFFIDTPFDRIFASGLD